MSIKAYTSIAESYNINNYFDITDDSYNKIRFSIKDKMLYITSYDTVSNSWIPASIICDNVGSVQTTSLIDYQDLIFSQNVRIQLDATIPANGSEVLIFQNINNYNYVKRSGLNYAIQSSPYLPTNNNDNRLVVYQLDSNGKPQLTLSPVSTNDFTSTFVTIANDQTINSKKTFSSGNLLLGGASGSKVTLNGSQTTGSSSYTLEWPTAAPSGTLNVLTTSGSSPYSKYIWTDLSNYTLASSFNQLSALNTTGSPTFANLSIASGGALNLNYMSTPSSSDIIATLNTNKQLTNSGTALSSLCNLGSAQTFTADKTFNYTAGKIKLSNYSTDNTTTNNLLTLNSSGYIVPCNKLYSDVSPFASSTAYTFTAKQTFSASSNPVVINNLTKSLSTDSDVLLSLDTTGNVKKTDILYSQLSPLTNVKVPIYQFKFQQDLSSSGSSTYSATSVSATPTYNSSGKYGYCLEPKGIEINGGFTTLNNSSGNDFSLTGWVKVNATGNSLRIRFDNVGGDQIMEFMMSDGVMPSYVGNGAQNGFDLRRFASDISKSQWVQTTNPNFNNSSDINKWWFFGFSWNSSTNTLSLYITDGGSNKFSNSQSYPTKSYTFNQLFRNLGVVSFMYTPSGTFVDDLRIYNSVLSTSEMDTLAQSSVDTLNYPNMLLDSSSQTITGAKTFNSNTLSLNGGGSANVILNAPSISSAYTLTLPSSNPTSGTTNVLTTTSTSSPYTLSWTDLASTYQSISGMSNYLTTANATSTYQPISGMSSYLTTTNASSTYLTQANAGTTYMKLNASQTNSGANIWSGNNTFNQDKLLLPNLTATSSGTYVLTKNASTGAIEYASSVSWNNIDLINSAQTITAIKTYDYSTAKITLNNTTNDNTTTNKVLVLNSSNQIVPCDKTYSNIGSGGGSTFSTSTPYTFTATRTFNASSNPLVVNNLTTATSTDNILSINSTNGNVTNTGFAFSNLSPLIASPIPIYQFNFENNNSYSSASSATDGLTNSSSNTTYSSSIYKFDSYSKYLNSNGVILNFNTNTGGVSGASINNASGNDYTLNFWFYYVDDGSAPGTFITFNFNTSTTSNTSFGGTIGVEFGAGIVTYLGQLGLNVSDITVPTHFGVSSNRGKWWFFSLSWNSSNNTFSQLLSDGTSSNTFTASTTATSSISTLNSIARAHKSIIINSSGNVYIDDLRMYNTALSSNQLKNLYTATSSSIKNILFDSDIQNITGAKTFSNNKLLLNGGGSANVTLNAPNISSAYTLTLPSSNPTSGTTNVLTTTSTSSPYNLSWTDLASTYQPISGMSSYLTTTNATSTYQPISGMSSYLTTANATSTYQPISGMSSYLTTANATSTYQTISGMSSYLTTANATSTYQTISAMASYLTTANATSTYQTISGMTSYLTTTNATSTYGGLSSANTWSGLNVFNSGKLTLAGNGGNLTLNASQSASSAAYTLEYPTAAPAGTMNVLTTSGSSPYSKYTWTDLSTYLTTTTAASTYQTISGMSSYLALSGTQTITGAKTFSGATTLSNTVTLSGTNTDTTTSSGQKLMVLNTTSNNIERVNITPDNIATLSGSQTFSANKYFSGNTLKILASGLVEFGNGVAGKESSAGSMGYQTYTSDALDIVGAGTAVGARKIKIWDNLVISNNLTINGATTLSGTNSDTTTSSGQKLMVLNTTSNNIERVNITPDNLVTLSGTQTISGTKTLSGATTISGTATLSNTVTLSGVNSDTATSSGQKLAVLNTTNNNVERINITPDNLATLSGTQTISGDKTFTGITRVLTQQNPGNNAKFSLTCSGIITFDSSNNLKWSNDVLIQSIDRSFLSLGYLRITCPTSGTKIGRAHV